MEVLHFLWSGDPRVPCDAGLSGCAFHGAMEISSKKLKCSFNYSRFPGQSSKIASFDPKN